MTERTDYRICPLCEACCGLEVRSSDQKVIGIRGAPDDVFSRGYICPKGFALKDLHEDPDRLRTPLIRRDGQLVEASWDEAYAEIEKRLPPIMAESGRDSVALTVGNPAAHKMGLLLYFARLARALGTKNLYSASTLDQMPKQLSAGLMFGHWMSVPLPDIDRSQFLLILGANPMASNGSLWTVPDYRGRAKALRARGGRIVVIDPRRTETAAAADAHHFIRPGTDVHLLAAMVQVLFAEDLVRPGRLEPWLEGVQAVRDAVAGFTPERAAAHCGIDAATIRALARELAGAERGCVYGRIGTCTQAHGTLNSWLVDVLNALTGHLDRPGGAMWPKAAAFAANTEGEPGKGRGVRTARHRSRVSGAPEVLGELPMTLLAEEIETAGPGRIRALITVASNPVLSAPNGRRLSAAFGQLDFMVSLDVYLNETTRHADVVLPGLSPLEESHYDISFTQLSMRNHARFSAPVFAPPPGQRAEWQSLLTLIGIARGRGASVDIDALDDEFFVQDLQRQTPEQAALVRQAVAGQRGPERLLDAALRAGPYGDKFGAGADGLTLAKLRAAPGGFDLGPMTERIPELLRTPSGRIELAPPSLIEALQPVLAAAPAVCAPLVIVGRRDVRSNNSWMHNLPTLAKGPERCTVLMHPQDAASFGVSEGDLVQLTSATGRVRAPVVLSADMMPGVASLPHGWGHDLPGTRLSVARERPGANLNDLLGDDARDVLSGNAVLSGVAVQVEAVGA